MTVQTQNNLLAKLSNISKGLIEEYNKYTDGASEDRKRSLNKIKSTYNELKSFIAKATAKTPETHFDGDITLLENQLKQHKEKYN